MSASHDGRVSIAVPTHRRAGSLLRQAARLAERATTPLLPADYLDLVDPLRRGADLRGRIVEVQPETADAATIVIRPGADWAGHVPGQYVRIGIDVDGVRQWRAYSLTHGPRPMATSRSPSRRSRTARSAPIWSGAPRAGTLVHLEQAAGEFVLPRAGTKLLFVTAGSGITPVIGMLRNLFPVADSGVVRLRRSADHDITVVHVGAERAGLDLHRQPARPRRRRSDPARHAPHRRARDLRRRRRCPTWCPTCGSAARSPAARPACSTPSRPTTSRARPPAAHRAVPRRHGGGRRGRHRHLRPQRLRPSRRTGRRRSSPRPRTPAC